MAARFDGPVFQDNERREADRKGEQEVCEDCKSTGIIGEDILAASTSIHNGMTFPWWICQSCADQRYPASN